MSEFTFSETRTRVYHAPGELKVRVCESDYAKPIAVIAPNPSIWNGLSPSDARQLARLLVEAADLVAEWAAREGK